MAKVLLAQIFTATKKALIIVLYLPNVCKIFVPYNIYNACLCVHVNLCLTATCELLLQRQKQLLYSKLYPIMIRQWLTVAGWMSGTPMNSAYYRHIIQ